MGPSDPDVDTPTTEQDLGRPSKEKGSSVADYLAAPRRKRKSFVLLALGKDTTADLQGPLEQFLRAHFKGAAIAAPRSVDDLMRNFARQIVLLVFDDEFTDLKTGLELVRELKRKRSGVGVPVLFLTRHPSRLVDAYNKVLLPWHEGDDYVDVSRSEVPLLLSKVRTGLTGGFKRRSRRYAIDIAAAYDLLTDDRRYPGRIIDMSVHGALLKAEDGRIFKPGEQLRLHLPVDGKAMNLQGDFLRLAARVRRVFIGGAQAGVSFEHLSEGQVLALTTFITDLVETQLARQSALAKARGGARG
jgi:hypothetical protein